MAKFQLKKPDLTLADFLQEIEIICPDELEKIQKEEAFPGMPKYSIVSVKIYGNDAILIFKNNGSIPFEDGTELNEIALDEPEFWIIQEIDRIEKIPNINEIEFSDNPDALEWEGEFDVESIEKAFKISKHNSGGWATFVGAYRIL